jgi:hypothetical protein
MQAQSAQIVSALGLAFNAVAADAEARSSTHH